MRFRFAVYSGRWGDDVVAVKRIVCKSDAKLQEVASEGSLGMMLNHPNVVKVIARAICQWSEYPTAGSD